MGTRIPLRLKDKDREYLRTVVSKGTTSARTIRRAQILLLSDSKALTKRSDDEIADLLGCHRSTCSMVRRKYQAHGLKTALYDQSRPGQPPKITGEIEARMVALVCSEPPQGRSRWTVRLLTERMIALEIIDDISPAAVHQRLKKNQIKPWQLKSWCIPSGPDAQFVARMEDVLAVYERPYDPKRPVICMDEKGKELLESPKGELPMEPGVAKRQDYTYKRVALLNMFLWVEPLAGRRGVTVTDRHTMGDFARQLKLLVLKIYRDAEKIVLVTDNLNIHTISCLYEVFPPEEARRIAERIEWHYTPKHASWMNVAEIELSVLERQCLRRRISSKAELVQEVRAWTKERNLTASKVNWQFKTADARIKLRRLYPVPVAQG